MRDKRRTIDPGNSFIENPSVSLSPLAPPVANFVANDTTVEVGQSVQFTDLSTNDPIAWEWFANGILFSIAQNPIYIPSVIGAVNIKLIAYNYAGNGVDSQNAYLNISASTIPVADFEIDNLAPSLNDDVSFTDISTNSPDTWQWFYHHPSVIGWIEFSTNQNPILTMDALGLWSIKLIASNSSGSDTEVKAKVIEVS